MPIIRCVLKSYVLVKWKKQITYTIHALLSKVTRSWNIPGNRKQKKDNENSKETPRYCESAQIQHRQLWGKAEKPCLIWANSPAFIRLRAYVLSLRAGPVHSLCVSKSFRTLGPWGLQPQSSPSSLQVWTQPQPCLQVPAEPEPLPTPWSVWWLQHESSRLLWETPSVLWATLLMPVTCLWPARIHRATRWFKKLTNGLGRQKKRKCVGLNIFLL